MKKPLPSRFIYLFPLVSLGVLALVYTGIAFYFNRFGVFWSPDSGTRFYMIRDWINHGSLVKPYYSAQNIDPTGKVHLLSYYLLRREHDFFSTYLPLFSLINAVAYKFLGYNGLTMIPALCGLGTVLLTYATALRLGLRSAPLVPLVMGLATPVLIFSVVFWDHTAIMLVAALAGYGMLRSLQTGKLKFAAWAGVALGTGIWLHELVLALFFAVVVSSLPLLRRPQQRRVAFAVVAGFIPLALLWCLANTLIYSSPGGPHIGMNVLQDSADHPFNLAVILDPKRLISSATSQLFGHMTDKLTNLSDNKTLYVLLFISLVAAYVVAGLQRSTSSKTLSYFLIGSTVLAFLLLGATHNGWGLLQATPLFVPALGLHYLQRSPRGTLHSQSISGGEAPIERAGAEIVTPLVPVGERAPEQLYYQWLSLTCWIYIALVIINPILPGVDWGSRYMLSVSPFLVLLAARALENPYDTAPQQERRTVVTSALVLVGGSLFAQCYGLVVVRDALNATYGIKQAAQTISSPVFVTDSVWVGPDLGATDLPNVQHSFSVRSSADRRYFLSLLPRLETTKPEAPGESNAPAEFTYLGSLAGLKALSSDATGSTVSFEPEETQYIYKQDAGRNNPNSMVMARFVYRGRALTLVPTSEAVPVVWRYTIDAPTSNWFKPAFDDRSWQTGKGGFGKDAPDSQPRSVWQSDDIYLRRSFTLPADFKERLKHLRVMLRAYHDEDMEVYINGVLACEASGYTTGYETYPLTEEGVATLHPGQNSIAVHCHQNNGGQFIDVGLVALSLDSEFSRAHQK